MVIAISVVRSSLLLSMAAALAVGLPVILIPHQVHGFFRGVVEFLF